MLREVFLTQAHSLGHDRESVARNFRIKSSLTLILQPLGSTFHFTHLTQAHKTFYGLFHLVFLK